MFVSLKNLWTKQEMLFSKQCDRRSSNEWAYIKTLIKDTLRDYLWHKTKRSPMILPIVMDIE